MRYSYLVSMLVLGLLLSVPAAAQNNNVEKPEATNSTDVQFENYPELVISGRTVMRLRSRAGGLSPEERAFSLRQRLGPILTLPNLKPEDVTVVQQRPNQTASIFVRGRLLVTVDTNLARANNTSIAGLAAQWAKNLKEYLPQVNVAVRMSRDLPVIKPNPAGPKTTQ